MKRLVLLLILLLLIPLPAAAQDGETYIDPDGLFSVPVPDGWDDQSTSEMAHFFHSDPPGVIYVFSVPSTDPLTAIDLGLDQVASDVSGSPLQATPAALPNGEWLQHIYVVGEDVVVILVLPMDEISVVLVARAGQGPIVTLNPAILETLIGIRRLDLPGQPPYTDLNSFTETDITFGLTGWELPGTLTLPNGDGPFPAAVIVHGSGPNDRDLTFGPNKIYRDLAWGLASRGIAVLRYDKRSFVHGTQMAALTSFTVWEETVEDARLAVEFLREQPNIDPAAVFVIGHSLGGHLAPRIAEGDSELAGLVLLAGNARPLEDLILEQTYYLTDLDGNITEAEAAARQEVTDAVEAIRTLESRDAPGLYLGAPAAYWWDMRDYDPVALAATLGIPMLILQGERDYQVTLEDYALWQEGLVALGNVSTVSFPALNHMFMAGEGQSRPGEYAQPGFMDEQVVRTVTAWIKMVAATP